MWPYDIRDHSAIASRDASRSSLEYDGMKKRCVRMPWRSSATRTSRVSGACIASYSRAIERAELRNAGCFVTSATRSPSIQTSRPSRRLSRYSSPVSGWVRVISAMVVPPRLSLSLGGREHAAVDRLGALGVAADDGSRRGEIAALVGIGELEVIVAQPVVGEVGAAQRPGHEAGEREPA